MQIILIRHGEPGHDPLQLNNPPLTDLGRAQAELLGAYLAEEGVDALYTSPLRRAAQTAAAVGSAVGLTPIVRDDLAEFDRDAAEYLDFARLAAERDPRYLAFTQGDLSPWGTDLPSFKARVIGEFDRIIAAHRSQKVAVVSHGGVANCYLGVLLGANRLSIHKPAHTGFARLKADSAGRREVVSMNETPHLRSLQLQTSTNQ